MGDTPISWQKKTDTLIYRGIWFVYIYDYISYIYKYIYIYIMFSEKTRDIKRLSYSRSSETEVMLNNFSYDLFIFCLFAKLFTHRSIDHSYGRWQHRIQVQETTKINLIIKKQELGAKLESNLSWFQPVAKKRSQKQSQLPPFLLTTGRPVVVS